jgi:hypothetical protein
MDAMGMFPAARRALNQLHSETPLHWAASSDDIDALDALLDLGADIESPGSVIGGGAPLSDAVAFGGWRAARRLIERGARSTIWQSAALGLLGGLREHFKRYETFTASVTNAFWNACHGANWSRRVTFSHSRIGLDTTS